MGKLAKLALEFKTLRQKIFGENSFVVIEEGDDMKRYNQLLGFFYPQFRTSDWESPL